MSISFEARLRTHGSELHNLYNEIYHDEGAWDYFSGVLRRCFEERKPALREQDEKRLSQPGWYKSSKLLGMMLYVENFAGNLSSMREKLPYIKESGVNYLHLMPLLDSPEGKSDGGYAVADFRSVRKDLGTMEDFSILADDCREAGILLCLDFVMNHTSDEHAWAKAARNGDETAAARYFIYNSRSIPDEYEKTVPQVFPTTAPGNFTQLADGRTVMTSFYPFQWDLNYYNPMVFNDMCENMLYLANRGVDVIRLDAVPYIWKELGTDCRNLPKVHTLVRMMKLAAQIVCPGVLLLGEVVMEPGKVCAYFGTEQQPECDMLYNVTTMCTTWHTLGTGDTGLLKHQLRQLCALGSDRLWQNYLRCHDDIGWGLDYPWLSRQGIEEVAHKKYLNDLFTGKLEGSAARGELYNDDPRLGDARLCGTTASLCGLESALEAGNAEGIELSLQCIRMLHAFMLGLSGIPVLYSGDELAALNDKSYHLDPKKADDSRFLHRGRFDWAAAERRKDAKSIEGRNYRALRELEMIRAGNEAFRADAEVSIPETACPSVIAMTRQYGSEKLLLAYNFSPRSAAANLFPGEGINLLTGEKQNISEIVLPACGFVWIRY